MTPATAAALRCPVCGGPLLLNARTLRCPKAHSFDLAREGYAYLLPMQKKHTADPGDGKAMVRARRAFLSAGHYAPLMQALAALCAELPHGHIVDAGCGEGSYDKYLYDALGGPQLAAFDLSKEAVRLASRLVPEAAFCVGGSFCAPVPGGWGSAVPGGCCAGAAGAQPDAHSAAARPGAVRGPPGGRTVRGGGGHRCGSPLWVRSGRCSAAQACGQRVPCPHAGAAVPAGHCRSRQGDGGGDGAGHRSGSGRAFP